MRKKQSFLISVIIAAVLLFTSLPVLAETAKVLMTKTNISINGKSAEITLLSYEGELYVPLAGVLDLFNDALDWESTQEAEAQKTDVATNVFTLGAGKHLVGRDIPAGMYNVVTVSGFGEISYETSDEWNYFYLSDKDNLEKAWYELSSDVSHVYENIFLPDGEVLISGTVMAQFTLVERIEKLLPITIADIYTSDLDENTYILGEGTYKAGRDIPPGRYDLLAISGYGRLRMITTTNRPPTPVMGKPDDIPPNLDIIRYSQNYNNFQLDDGDEFYITDVIIQFKLKD